MLQHKLDLKDHVFLGTFVNLFDSLLSIATISVIHILNSGYYDSPDTHFVNEQIYNFYHLLFVRRHKIINSIALDGIQNYSFLHSNWISIC